MLKEGEIIISDAVNDVSKRHYNYCVVLKPASEDSVSRQQVQILVKRNGWWSNKHTAGKDWPLKSTALIDLPYKDGSDVIYLSDLLSKRKDKTELLTMLLSEDA